MFQCCDVFWQVCLKCLCIGNDDTCRQSNSWRCLRTAGQTMKVWYHHHHEHPNMWIIDHKRTSMAAGWINASIWRTGSSGRLSERIWSDDLQEQAAAAAASFIWNALSNALVSESCQRSENVKLFLTLFGMCTGLYCWFQFCYLKLLYSSINILNAVIILWNKMSFLRIS